MSVLQKRSANESDSGSSVPCHRAFYSEIFIISFVHVAPQLSIQEEYVSSNPTNNSTAHNNVLAQAIANFQCPIIMNFCKQVHQIWRTRRYFLQYDTQYDVLFPPARIPSYHVAISGLLCILHKWSAWMATSVKVPTWRNTRCWCH